MNPDGSSVASRGVRKDKPERWPEEPDQSAEVQIVVSPAQYHWLTRQSEFLGLTKQEMIADILEEWVGRNRCLPRIDPSTMVGWALDDFMRRHRDEFLAAES